MFASKSVPAHVFRGLLGVTGLGMASVFASAYPLLSIGCVIAALVALRGCPLCWTIGLVQTIVARLRGDDAGRTCADGRCTVGDPRER